VFITENYRWSYYGLHIVQRLDQQLCFTRK